MSDERSFENEEVLGRAIAATNQHTARFFDIVSDYELRYSNLEGHVLAIYDVDDADSPHVLTPYFDDLRTYNVKGYFAVPTNKIYYIVDITEYTGRDLPSKDADYSVEGFKKLTMPRHKNEQIEIASQLAEEDSEDRFQGILGEQSIKEVIEDKDEEDKVNQPSHYTFSDKFEIIDVVEEITSQYPPHLAFAIGNAVKYIARSQHKNGKQDIEKSIWYLQRVLEKYDEE